MTLEERMRSRLAELKEGRERVALALAGYDAAIGEIAQLLDPPAEAEEAPADAGANPAAPPDLPPPPSVERTPPGRPHPASAPAAEAEQWSERGATRADAGAAVLDEGERQASANGRAPGA